MIDELKEPEDLWKLRDALPEGRFNDEEEEEIEGPEPDNIIDFESFRKEHLKKTSFDNASVDYNYFDDYVYEF